MRLVTNQLTILRPPSFAGSPYLTFTLYPVSGDKLCRSWLAISMAFPGVGPWLDQQTVPVAPAQVLALDHALPAVPGPEFRAV